MSFGVAGKQAADLTTQALPNFAAAPNFTPTAPLSPTAQMAENLGSFGSGVKNLTGFGDMSIGDAYSKFTQAGGTAGQLAMPVGGAVLAGLEPSDLGYGTGSLYEDPDKGKYRGPQGQLNLSDKYSTGLRLVAKGGEIKSYAIGGGVGNPSVGGGLADLYNRPEGQTLENISNDGYGIGRLDRLASQESLNNAKTLGYADGGDVASGDLSAESAADLAAFQAAQANNPSGLYGINSGGYGITAPSRAVIAPSYTLSPEMQRSMAMRDLERQRIAAYTAPSYRQNYARGGYLDGAGDGMSDSIPATIEGKQPARLADGEFVIPADVVSHLGNGSSKAGSKRLYAMLDKVRQARTGTKKQGKEINPAKYMPA